MNPVHGRFHQHRPKVKRVFMLLLWEKISASPAAPRTKHYEKSHLYLYDGQSPCEAHHSLVTNKTSQASHSFLKKRTKKLFNSGSRPCRRKRINLHPNSSPQKERFFTLGHRHFHQHSPKLTRVFLLLFLQKKKCLLHLHFPYLPQTKRHKKAPGARPGAGSPNPTRRIGSIIGGADGPAVVVDQSVVVIVVVCGGRGFVVELFGFGTSGHRGG